LPSIYKHRLWHADITAGPIHLVQHITLTYFTQCAPANDVPAVYIGETGGVTALCLLCCRVGRLDGSQAAPLAQLPPADMTAEAFVAWWTARGFTVAEAVALMGSHALLDDQGCYR
jgi:hypothetical protein